MSASQNFISYSDLNLEDSRLFLQARLNYFLNKAGLQIFGKDRLLCSYESKLLKIAPDKLVIINNYIEYILGLMGGYLNKYEKRNAVQVHKALQKEAEQEFFFFNLFTAIVNYKSLIIERKYPERLKEVKPANKISNFHHELKAIEKSKGEIKFQIGQKLLREKDIYNTAVFYVMNFAFGALKSNDIQRFSRILISIDDLKFGPSYQAAYGKSGGKKSGVKRSRNKNKARKLFNDNNMYVICKGKAEAILADFMPILQKNKIFVSEETVRTEWIPEFSKPYKALKNIG